MMMARNTLFLLSVLLLAACGGLRGNTVDDYNSPEREQIMDRQGGLFGDDGLVLFGNQRSGNNRGNEQGGALGVNAYLWRGALDTLSFMPLVSADPFGGVIITDWYEPQGAPGERFKATAYILGRQLRADGIRISLFRQVRQGNNWVDAAVSAGTQGELEDKVLARARELRIQAASR